MPSTARTSLNSRTSPSASMPFRSIGPTLATGRSYAQQQMRRLVLLVVGVAVLAAGCGSGKTVTVTTTETVTRTVTAPVVQKNVRVYVLLDRKVGATGRVV